MPKAKAIGLDNYELTTKEVNKHGRLIYKHGRLIYEFGWRQYMLAYLAVSLAPNV